jgi:hypothetical protein
VGFFVVLSEVDAKTQGANPTDSDANEVVSSDELLASGSAIVISLAHSATIPMGGFAAKEAVPNGLFPDCRYNELVHLFLGPLVGTFSNEYLS